MRMSSSVKWCLRGNAAQSVCAWHTKLDQTDVFYKGPIKSNQKTPRQVIRKSQRQQIAASVAPAGIIVRDSIIARWHSFLATTLTITLLGRKDELRNH